MFKQLLNMFLIYFVIFSIFNQSYFLLIFWLIDCCNHQTFFFLKMFV